MGNTRASAGMSNSDETAEPQAHDSAAGAVVDRRTGRTTPAGPTELGKAEEQART
jgi:hypothetical protein